MSTCKLIVMDMDGTLLNSQGEISKRTYDALIKAQEKGIRVILCSGRSWKTLKDYSKHLRMSEFDGYCIGANGAVITETKTETNTIISQLQINEIKEIFEAAKTNEVEIMGVLDSTIYDYIPDSLKELKRQYKIENNIPEDIWTGGTFCLVEDQSVGYSEIYSVDSFDDINCPIYKMTFCHTKEMIEIAYKDLVEKLSDKYNITKTSISWFEIGPKCVSKGNAISLLQNKLNIKKEETYIFGDGENDLSMFECGIAIAMGNAMETVKAQANEVTLDNNSDGIAVVIEGFL